MRDTSGVPAQAPVASVNTRIAVGHGVNRRDRARIAIVRHLCDLRRLRLAEPRIRRDQVKNLIEIERRRYRTIDLSQASGRFFLNRIDVRFQHYFAFVITAPRPLISSVCPLSS